MAGTGPEAAYSAAFLDHLVHPRGAGHLAGATHRGSAEDGVCGDRLTLDLRVERGEIVAVRYRVEGCPGAIAAGSALTSLLPGRAAGPRAIEAAEIEAALDGVPAAKRHALRLAIDTLRTAVASPLPTG